jgi:hypothetical protein
VNPQNGPVPFGAQKPQAAGPQQKLPAPQVLEPHFTPPPSLAAPSLATRASSMTEASMGGGQNTLVTKHSTAQKGAPPPQPEGGQSF